MAHLRTQQSSFPVLISVSYLIAVLLFQVSRSKALVVDLTIRLDDGPHEGIVEVFHENEWGTISTENMDPNAPEIICRQLGFEGDVQMQSRNNEGRLTTPVWRIEKCNKSALSISGCEKPTLDDEVPAVYSEYEDIRTFDHSNDLWVMCTERETTGGPTTMLLVIDFVAFGLTIICIIIFAGMVVYCATRSKKPEAKGDSAYQEYKHSSSGNSTYTDMQPVGGTGNTQSVTAGGANGAGPENSYAAINSGFAKN